MVMPFMENIIICQNLLNAKIYGSNTMMLHVLLFLANCGFPLWWYASFCMKVTNEYWVHAAHCVTSLHMLTEFQDNHHKSPQQQWQRCWKSTNYCSCAGSLGTITITITTRITIKITMKVTKTIRIRITITITIPYSAPGHRTSLCESRRSTTFTLSALLMPSHRRQSLKVWPRHV